MKILNAVIVAALLWGGLEAGAQTVGSPEWVASLPQALTTNDTPAARVAIWNVTMERARAGDALAVAWLVTDQTRDYALAFRLVDAAYAAGADNMTIRHRRIFYAERAGLWAGARLAAEALRFFDDFGFNHIVLPFVRFDKLSPQQQRDFWARVMLVVPIQDSTLPVLSRAKSQIAMLDGLGLNLVARVPATFAEIVGGL